MFCCPLCEENVSECICGFGVEKENDKSITLTSEDDLRVCAACGVFTKSCLCDFQRHNLNLDTGICSKCGVFQPGNQVCPTVVISDQVITSTPKMESTRGGNFSRKSALTM